jgi:hypothetical protein
VRRYQFVLNKVLTMAKKSVKLYTDNVLEEFYKSILNDTLDELHIPHSDVFYVRTAVEAHYGRKFSLKHVEDAMRAEGWTESSYAKNR